MQKIDEIRQRLLQLQLADIRVRSIVVSMDVMVDKNLAPHMHFSASLKREQLLGYPLKIVGDSDNTIAFELE